MGLDKDEARALVRDHDVVYIYHNLIDAIGDKQVSEERVFEAAEDNRRDRPDRQKAQRRKRQQHDRDVRSRLHLPAPADRGERLLLSAGRR